MPATDSLAALADPIRHRIVELLAEGEACVSELARQLPVSRSAVSQHLAVLTQAGLAQERRDGRFRRYRLRPGPLGELSQLLARWSAIEAPETSAADEVDDVDEVVSTLLDAWPELDPLATAFLTRLQLLGRLMQSLMAQAARGEGITAPDVILLGTLRRLGPPCAATPTRLSANAVLSMPVMLKRLETLRRRGLIERQPDPDDRRASLIVLTPRGAEAIDRIMRKQFLQNLVAVAELPPGERRLLADSLRNLLRGFRTAARGDGADP